MRIKSARYKEKIRLSLYGLYSIMKGTEREGKNMGLRKTFDDYSDQKIYDKVEDRKNELVCRWRAGERLPLIRVSEQKGTEENWLETLRVQCDSNENITDIVEFSTDPPYVILRTPKGKKTFCEAICVEYFRLHEIADKGTAFRRYTYFEMYYDDKVIACYTLGSADFLIFFHFSCILPIYPCPKGR